MASLEIDNQEIKETVGMFLGISRTPGDWDATTIADVDRIIRTGRRRFFSAHTWHFLEQDFRVVTEAPQTTGTVEISSGVVTLTGATWPTEVVTQYMLKVSDSLYEVNTRDSTTQITLHDTSATASSGSSYELFRVGYSLPSDFAGFLTPVYMENNDRSLLEMPTLPSWTVNSEFRKSGVREGKPEMFALNQTVDDAGIPTYMFIVFPLPDDVYVLSARYRIQPGDSLDLADSTTSFHSVFSEVLMSAILSAAEQYYNDTAGIHTAQFQQMLPQAIRKDGQMRGTRALRPRSNRSQFVRNLDLINSSVSFDGVD